MNLEQAKRVSGLFVELVNEGRLSPCGRYCWQSASGVRYFSPLGYLVYGRRPEALSSGLLGTLTEQNNPIYLASMVHTRHYLFVTYGMTPDEAEIIQNEWLKEHDVGNLIRMPLMVREED